MRRPRYTTPRSIVRSSVRSSVRSVTGVSGIDSDAAAYIAALEGDGETVTPTQQAALDTFFRAGKSDGWYSILKRAYLPIWGDATPNARCMVSATSGEFNGTVTHAAGYVQGDASTGYFAADATIQTILGGATNLGGLFLLGANDVAASMSVGAFFGTTRLRLFSTGTSRRAEIGTNAATIIEAGNASGVLVSVRRSNTDAQFYRRSSGGFASVGTYTTSTPDNFPDLVPYFTGGANNNGSLLADSTAIRQGAYGVIGSATTEQITDFTAALKTLWETCTGLTLP